LTRDYYFTAHGFGDVAVADVDKDGYKDFILSDGDSLDGNSTFSIYLFKPVLGEYALNATVKVMGNHSQMVVDDVNNDGGLDVTVLTVSPQTVQIFMPTAAGFATVRGPSTVIWTPRAIGFAIGSLTGSASGHDIAVVYPDNVTVYSYLGAPRYFDPSVSEVLNDTAGYRRAIVSDADDDTLPDLVLASPNRIRIFYGKAGYIVPSGVVNCVTYQIAGAQTGEASIATSDVTSDGRTDLVMVVSNRTALNGTLVVLARSGSSLAWQFTEVFRDSRDFSSQLAVADLNYDAADDIAVVLYSGGNIAFFYQQPGGTFHNRVDLQINGTTSSGNEEFIASGDLAGGNHYPDGYEDIAIRASVAGNSTVSIFHQQDSPVGFTRPIPYQCPSDCFYINQGDSGNNLIDLRDYFVDDHGPVVYNVVYQEAPASLHATLSADGHHLDFTAATGWYGIASFRVAANDIYPGHPPIESNNFTVMVNSAPRITSTPTSQVELGGEYRYLPSVDDPFPVNDFQRFELIEGPSSLSLDASSGLIRWTPAAEGSFAIAIKAVDSFGAGSAVQRFTVNVVAPPSTPPGTIDIPIPRDTTSVMVIGVTVAAILLIAAVAVMSENAKYGLLLLIVPLYSKIKREKVLDHFIRGQIFGYIMANPGEHYNSIKQALDMTNGSLAHHLRTLERERFVKSKRFGL